MTQMMDALFIAGFVLQTILLFMAVYNVMRLADWYSIKLSVIFFCVSTLAFGMQVFIMILNQTTEFYYMFIDLPSWLYALYGILFVIEILFAVGRTVYDPFVRGVSEE